MWAVSLCVVCNSFSEVFVDDQMKIHVDVMSLLQLVVDIFSVSSPKMRLLACDDPLNL